MIGILSTIRMPLFRYLPLPVLVCWMILYIIEAEKFREIGFLWIPCFRGYSRPLPHDTTIDVENLVFIPPSPLTSPLSSLSPQLSIAGFEPPVLIREECFYPYRISEIELPGKKKKKKKKVGALKRREEENCLGGVTRKVSILEAPPESK